MGLRIGKRFKGKKKVFIFSFKTSFPIILSNQILQYESPCTLLAPPSCPEQRRGELQRRRVSSSERSERARKKGFGLDEAFFFEFFHERPPFREAVKDEC